jgi:hypothetical protein
MATISLAARAHPRPIDVVVRVLLVGLTLSTAAIHASLGGMLFLANAIGYATFAMAMIVPGPIGQVRWMVRLGLAGFTAATIGGWVLFGARFPLAYLDKGIELGLIAAIAFEIWRVDGGPIGIVRQARRLVARLTGLQVARERR